MKLWGSRFARQTDGAVEEFTGSLGFDRRLFRHDIAGSKTHAALLEECRLLTEAECAAIQKALDEIEEEMGAGGAGFPAEDVHTEIELRLRARVGELAGKLRAGRSRNDQVALDMHLYAREEIREIQRSLLRFQVTLVRLAEAHPEVIMPGFTHLQHAQPVLFAHHLLAYFFMFQRDIERLEDCRARADMMPLGAAALAGSGFPLDRERAARLLGFRAMYENSLDAVSDRDFLVELAAACALIAVHLSRLSEELVLWSTREFGFVELDEAFCTGSSIMPQKKNPDVPELVRGKAGRVFGALMALLAMMKALPLAYNRDMQEDKEAIFDCVDTTRACLRVLERVVATMRVCASRFREALRGDFSQATDLADYLAQKGVPFAEAHDMVGRLVLSCARTGKLLEELTLEELRAYSPFFAADSLVLLDPAAGVERRKVRGGTATAAVCEEIARAKSLVERTRKLLADEGPRPKKGARP